MSQTSKFMSAVRARRPIGLGFSPEGAPLAYAFPNKREVLWVLEGLSEGESIREVESHLEGYGLHELFRNRAQCPRCGEIIESRWRNDHRSCGCGGISVDGGYDYLRRGWSDERPIERSELIWTVKTEKPLCRVGDKVEFWSANGGHDGEWVIRQGEVCIVDFNGAIGCTEHSYDIEVEEENMLYKHVEQKFVIGRVQ